MRKLKEVLRLRYELGLGQRQIARSCSIGHGTVYEYLKRAREAGVRWPLPEGWDDRQLEAALFGGTPRRTYETQKPPPDFAQLHEELQRHPHLTLQLPATGHEFTKHVVFAKPRTAMMERHLRRIIGHATSRAEAHRVGAGALEVFEPELGIELARVILDQRELRPAHGLVHPTRRRRSHRWRIGGVKLGPWPSCDRDRCAGNTRGLQETSTVHGD